VWLTIVTDALAVAMYETAQFLRVDVHQLAWVLALVAKNRLADARLTL
jgi:hypothetical protein